MEEKIEITVKKLRDILWEYADDDKIFISLKNSMGCWNTKPLTMVIASAKNIGTHRNITLMGEGALVA